MTASDVDRRRGRFMSTNAHACTLAAQIDVLIHYEETRYTTWFTAKPTEPRRHVVTVRRHGASRGVSA